MNAKAPTFVTAGRPGEPPFQVESYDIAKRRRLRAEGVSEADARAAALLPASQGRVNVSVAALNKILASCSLGAAELARLLAM